MSSSVKKPKPIFEIIMDTGAIMRGELYPDAAPDTAGNFIHLANNGFYDGLDFHRCICNFIIQGGKPETDLPYCIHGEFEFNNDRRNRLPHEFGSLCMSRGKHYDSANSQFYIVVTMNDQEMKGLDGAYAVFGKVLEGMRSAVILSFAETDEMDKPILPQRIRSIRVETFGVDYPFETLPPPKSDVNLPATKNRGQRRVQKVNEERGFEQ